MTKRLKRNDAFAGLLTGEFENIVKEGRVIRLSEDGEFIDISGYVSVSGLYSESVFECHPKPVYEYQVLVRYTFDNSGTWYALSQTFFLDMEDFRDNNRGQSGVPIELFEPSKRERK